MDKLQIQALVFDGSLLSQAEVSELAQKFCNEQGLKIGVTFAGTRGALTPLIQTAEATGFPSAFSVASDEVSAQPDCRPHPWMLLKTQEALQVFPAHTLVKIAGTSQDVEEGRNFGAWTVAIGAPESFSQTNPDFIIPKISDLSQCLQKMNCHLGQNQYPGSTIQIPVQPYRLFTPGPISTSVRVKTAMMSDWGSRDQGYESLVRGVRQRLSNLLAASAADDYTTVLVQGSGTFAVESVLWSAIGKNKLLIIANGQYGLRIAKMARLQELNFVCKEFPEDVGLTVDAVRPFLETEDFSHVAFVHSETTTGLLNPADEICQLFRAAGKRVIVDAISSIGAVPIDAAKWDADFVIGSSNKGIQSVPGFAFVIAKRTALNECVGISKSLSLDLYEQWVNLEKSSSFRFTSPTHCIKAFSSALDELEEEGGIERRSERYFRLQKKIADGFTALGFQPLALKGKQGPVITTFVKEKDFDFERFYSHLKTQGCLLYPGKIATVDSFRIGSIGYLFDEDVEHLLECAAKYLQNK